MSPAVIVRVTPPDVPVNVTVYGPLATDFGRVKVAVALALAPKVTDAGNIAHVVPTGPPLQPSETVPAKPFTEVTVTV